MEKYKENNIDVVIPAYNAEKFILSAIKSVEAQTLKPHRLFVVNDGSTDNTAGVVENYKSNCVIPLTYIAKKNGGPNSARNLGLAQSKANFVAFLDADDIWRQDKLEKQMAVFEKKEFANLGLVYAKYDVIDALGVLNPNAYIVPLDTKIRGNAFAPLLSGNRVLGSASSVLIKRDVFEAVGTFDEQLYFGEDWDMWLRIAEKYDIDYAPETLVHVRRHEANQTNDFSKVFMGEIDFFNKWITKIDGKYPAPIRWKDQIAFHMIIALPRIGFINKTQNKMSPTLIKNLFKETFGSILLYTALFCFRKIFNPISWKQILDKLKKHA